LWSFSEKAFERSTLTRNAGTPLVKTMITLAAMKNPAIHRDAISALRGFKHRAAFPALAAALDDPDRYVRYDAMFTLCSAMNVHGVGCPATAEFERNEQTYITRVRTWWRRQQP
jgi:hypothetical protein